MPFRRFRITVEARGQEPLVREDHELYLATAARVAASLIIPITPEPYWLVIEEVQDHGSQCTGYPEA